MSEPHSENFSHAELKCKCGCHQNKIRRESLDRLQMLRDQVGPLAITSAYRCPAHNNAVSGTGWEGPHTTGQAFDIRCFGDRAQLVIEKAIELGFTGIGVKQKGPHGSRIIHVDDLSKDDGCPRPWIWSY